MMKLLSFDAMRTCDISGIAYIKPELTHMHIHKILQADWLLFAPKWLVNALYLADRCYFFEFNRLFGTAGLKKMGISAGSLIYAYLHSTIIEDSSMGFMPKVGSLVPENAPAALPWLC